MVVSRPGIRVAVVELSTGTFPRTSKQNLAIPDVGLHSHAIVHGFVCRDVDVNAVRSAGEAVYSGSTPAGVIFIMTGFVFSNRNMKDIPIGANRCLHDFCVTGGPLAAQDNDLFVDMGVAYALV